MGTFNVVLPHAIKTPSIKKLEGKRVVLASASPRRKDILETFVRRSFACLQSSYVLTDWHAQGLSPEIVPSTFKEDLVVSSFEDIHEYPVATATHKAVEVYERLVVRFLQVFHRGRCGTDKENDSMTTLTMLQILLLVVS